MNRKYLLWILGDWGTAVSKRFEDSGYSSATPVGKMMELGIAASDKNGTALMSNYWPNAMISDVNSAIGTLPKEDVELFVYKYVLMLTLEKIGKVLKTSKGGVWNKMNQAENKLIQIL